MTGAWAEFAHNLDALDVDDAAVARACRRIGVLLGGGRDAGC